MDAITLSFTGHRSDKLGGYKPEAHAKVVRFATSFLERWVAEHSTPHCISGMALGWDQAVAEACTLLGIPWTAAVPFKGQQSAWPEPSRVKYRALLAKAARVHVVSPGMYSPAKMHKRNAWMVDNSDLLVALWNGSEGGTAACVRHAVAVGKPHQNEWKNWVRFTP